MLAYGASPRQIAFPESTLSTKPPLVSSPRPIKLWADAVVVAVTVVWGSSFVVVKNVYESAPPLRFLFWRFLLASILIFLLVAAARSRPSTPGLLRDGLCVGLLLAAGMTLQVLGIPDTSASNAAFLTGLSVVLTPFAAYLRTRRLPSLENGIGIALASLGFFLLTWPAQGTEFSRGDAFLFGCGIVFAFYIVELAERAGRHDALALTAIQLATVALLALTLSLLLRALGPEAGILTAREARPVVWRGAFLWGVLYLGSIGTVGTFVGQTWAQRHMSATHAAILFALEPVVAAILAAVFLAERLTPRGIAGAFLILAGIVVSEIRLSGARRSAA